MSIYDVVIVYTDGNTDRLTIEEDYLYETLDLREGLILKAINGDLLVINMQYVTKIGFILAKD